VFDLDDPFILRSMYQVVLWEAIRAEELTRYLNRDLLLAVWRDLSLPRGCGRPGRNATRHFAPLRPRPPDATPGVGVQGRW
jgi:hypothetical protein